MGSIDTTGEQREEPKPSEGRKYASDAGTDRPQANRWEWVESKLSLLLIGAVTTGLIVPWLQYTQQTVSWVRENRHSYLEHHLEASRGALNEFAAVHALVVESQHRATLALRSSVHDNAPLIQYRAHALETRSQLARQIGRFVGMWNYFHEDDQRALEAAFERYEAALQSLWYQHDHAVEEKFVQRLNGEKNRRRAAEVTTKWEVVDHEATNAYREVFRLLAQHIKRLEDESLSGLTLLRAVW